MDISSRKCQEVGCDAGRKGRIAKILAEPYMSSEESGEEEGLHAFTGCDSVSSFAGIGKVNPLKILRKNDEFQQVFVTLGEEWSVTEELFGKLEAFVCALHGTSDVNELRYALFCAKKGEAESHQLPLCRDC